MPNYSISWQQKGSPKQSFRPVRKRGFFRSNLVMGFILFLLVLGWLSLLMYHPYFQIKTVLLESSNVENEEIYTSWLKTKLKKNHALGLNSNYFVFSEKKVVQEIFEKFEVEKVKITKDFPDTIILNIQEKQDEIFVYRGEELSRYYTNGDVKLLSKEDTPLIRKIEEEVVELVTEDDPNKEEVGESKLVFDKYGTLQVIRKRYKDIPVLFISKDRELASNDVKLIIYFTTLIKEGALPQGIGVGEWYFLLYDTSDYELHLYTSSLKIIFDKKKDPDEQVNLLNSLLIAEKDLSTIEYIDVRLSNTGFIQRK